MENAIVETKEQIISYQKLRTFIGIIGIFLPFVLILGCYLQGDASYAWQPSISHYYYSKMHIVFMCALCVLGGFLITYKGKKEDPWESRVSNLAGYLAFSVAAFPTTFEPFRYTATSHNQYLVLTTQVTNNWGIVHFCLAGALFLCFVVFCLWFFQKPDNVQVSLEELIKFNRRKSLYTVCGWGILVSIALLLFVNLFYTGNNNWLGYTTLFFETTSLLFFGTAWLIKGSLFWKNYVLLRWVIKPFR